MKKYLIIVMLIIYSLLLTSCKRKNIEKEDIFKVGYSTNLLKVEDREKFKKILMDNNISNIELFFSWLDDFNKEEDNGCGLSDFKKTEEVKYNEFSCLDRYEKNHEVSDGNCRLTAYTLIQNRLKINNKIKNYGSYLMFDVDVLENNKNYEVINDSFEDFITLYNEIDVSNVDEKEITNAFSKKWEEYGISINKGNVSLISVVIYDKDNKTLFTGHTGILIKLKNRYIFVEKIAFEQPYQINIFNDINDLIDIFSKRPSYFESESKKGTYVFENEKLIYSY